MDDEKRSVAEISKYISEDFSKTDKSAIITNKDFNDLNELRKYLTDKISEMMDSRFEQLVNTLYLIDVDESKLSKLFHSDNREEIPEKLADLIIERQMQKFYLREKYRKGEL